jgi:hypothetical protein
MRLDSTLGRSQKRQEVEGHALQVQRSPVSACTAQPLGALILESVVLHSAWATLQTLFVELL